MLDSVDYKVARLSNEYMSLSIVPGFGARIIELIDKRTGRDWILPGSLDVDTAEDAVYGSAQATGWDECFPTVAPCEAGDLAWAEKLRDHGALWGRPWVCTFNEDSVLAIRSTEQFQFQRRLQLKGSRIQIDYTLDNRMPVSMPWLWSQHCLLNTTSADSISLSGMGSCTSSYLVKHEEVHPNRDFTWPELGSEFHDLSLIKECDAQFALKAYAPVMGDFRAVVGDEQGQLSYTFSSSCVPFVGIWLSYGGWPDADGVHQIAIEPTNAPVDDLRSALDANHSVILPADCSTSWSVSVSLLDPVNASQNNTSTESL